MGSVDTEHRALCHALFDAIEREDLEGMRRCYTPDMMLWFNVTGQESSGEDTIAAQVAGRELLRRRRTYDDRIISTFDDGFVVQYTLHDRPPRRVAPRAVGLRGRRPCTTG